MDAIHIKDLLAKESTTTGDVNLDISNINIKDILKPGDNIVVQVKSIVESKRDQE